MATINVFSYFLARDLHTTRCVSAGTPRGGRSELSPPASGSCGCDQHAEHLDCVKCQKNTNATPLKYALIIMAAVLTSGDSPVAAHGSAIAQRQDGPAFSDVQKGDGTTSAKGMEGKGWLVGVFGTRRSLMTLALGQVITLFTAGTGICSQYLAQEGVRLCSPARH